MESLWRDDRIPVVGTAFHPGAHHDVIVVGAGITGLSTALMLARAGRDVAVVDAGEVAELATGGNTGKVSLLQGTVLSRMRRFHSAALVRAYVDANRDGMDWLAGFADSAGVPYSRQTAYTYAQDASGLPAVESEFAAGIEAGLPVRRVDAPDDARHPFPFAGGVALDDQIAVDPVMVADALARDFLAAGGTLHTGTRVTGVRVLPHGRISTAEGPAFADDIVLATATPIADRGLYFAKIRGLRSYCVAFRTDQAIPPGMFLSAVDPARSIRPVTWADGPVVAQLIVGGGGHPVGRARNERAGVDDIVAWTRQYVPDAAETHRWSAQDYESHNLVPFVGGMPRGLGRIRFATGFNKWGLANGPAAALRITAEIQKTPRRERPRWMFQLGTRLTVPADVGRGIVENARIGAAAAKGWLSAETTPVPVPRPAEGQGVVAQRGGRPVAVSTVDGTTRAVSAVCTHLGGILDWNDAECTWDCPLHASRFRADGTRIEGPAVRDLDRISEHTDRAVPSRADGGTRLGDRPES